ncbi:MAG: PadR family transcriptional regulator [Solirubrobacterales bacterium]
MPPPRLTDTSHAVLGLLDGCGPSTPYRLKQIAQAGMFHIWSIPHTQLYTECARLAEAGLLTERREEGGRRRRVYSLSSSGRKALERWLADPRADLYELRDPGLLKLSFGADPAALAETQLEHHRARLAAYEEILGVREMPDSTRLPIEAGIGHEREYIRFWSRLRGDDGESVS